MFNWATSKLNALSETLAPPPSTPTHRFLSALSQLNENLALSILSDLHEPLDVYASMNNRGMSSIHVAASHGSLKLVREVLARGVRVDLTDYNGWTALHHASACNMNSLPLVKYLVEECSASILLKTNDGATAYDVASSQTVRGYLLPRQLQLETKECLDNGGKGLMPGIDLGGCRVSYNNLAPPPVVGGGPPMGGGGGPPVPNSYDPSSALMQPPPVRGIGGTPRQPAQQQQQPGMMSPSPMQSNVSSVSSYSDQPAASAQENFSQQQQWQPPPAAANQPPVGSTQPVTQDQQQQNWQSPSIATEPTATPPTQPDSQGQHQPPAPAQTTQPEPTQPPQPQPPKPSQPPRSNNSSAPSSGYALRGGNANSASVLSESSGRAKIYKPDGFHSSSNDKELQAKYGHVANEFEASRKAAVPPPPVSGGAPTAPPSGGYNPYSAARPTGGYIGGSGRARYPAYCAVSDSVSAPPSLSGSGYQYNAAVVPKYANFHQGGFNAQQQPVQQNQYGAGYNQQQWQGEQQNQYANNAHQQSVAPVQQWQGEQQNQYAYQQNAAPVQQQQWQGDTQQNQSTPAYQQSGTPTQQQQWTVEVQPSQPMAANTVPGTTQNITEPSPASQTFSEPSAPTASPPNQNQLMASDAAINMFGTPHADTPKNTVAVESESMPSLPMDTHAQELFASPTVSTASTPAKTSGSVASTPAKSEVAADVFASPPSTTQPASDVFASPPSSVNPDTTENNATVAETAPEDAGSFFGSPAQTENANNPHVSSDVNDKNAGEKTGEVAQNNITETQPPVANANVSSAPTPVKSFGGLPPPPVIGGMRPMSASSNYTPSGGTFLPPPPMASSFQTSVKEAEDIAADQMADVSLS